MDFPDELVELLKHAYIDHHYITVTLTQTNNIVFYCTLCNIFLYSSIYNFT